MTRQRYMKVLHGHGELTPKEEAQGWHLCPDWGDLLIRPPFKCSCHIKKDTEVYNKIPKGIKPRGV